MRRSSADALSVRSAAELADAADDQALGIEANQEMTPYKIIEETETHTTYEYRPAYTWSLYAVLVVLIVGFMVQNMALTVAGGVAIGIYFIAKLGLGSEATGRIKKAMQANAVQISGNKASFSNPLRIKVPK